MSQNKVKLGQFFTKNSIWLKKQVRDFILSSGAKTIYDPFAGAGDLLDTCKKILGFKKVLGLDIDPSLNWDLNDSLVSIPQELDSIIVTNPPYVAKQSATRKKLGLEKYFKDSTYDDIYLIALDRMLESSDFVVAIVPESFINSSYKKKDRLSSITILEENPFLDTTNPVCVVCFDNISKTFDKIKLYKGDTFINYYSNLLSHKLEPSNRLEIKFNDSNGWLGLRAIDSSDPKNKICFDFKENINYDWKGGIKESSRHFSLVSVEVSADKRGEFVKTCNSILNEIRENSCDVILTPFKGNARDGKRRRRLDFRLARAVMERASSIMGTSKNSNGKI